MYTKPKLLSDPDKYFEKERAYIHIRKKEGRVYSNETVKHLPNFPGNLQLHSEWKVRKKSSNKLIRYLTLKKQPLQILEVGCGNGWLSNSLSQISGSEVMGVDLNIIELGQAAESFSGKSNLKFAYYDIFDPFPFEIKFDVIVIAAAIQYFPDPQKLIGRLLELLHADGEIHIIDSPIYTSESEALEAKKRSKDYFLKQGVPEMSQYYFHHSNAFLKNYSFRQIKPSLLEKALRKSQFPWLIIGNE
ncbi:MAG TPA: class I SAM-dependent methyltransferase [Bacteroidia bacterium]|nr:class I SAM-dependent methyltransferase [Bacteroidia bacterium]